MSGSPTSGPPDGWSSPQGSLVDLPLVEDSVDAIITVNTFYFLEDPRPALREIARVLRPGGRVVIGIGDPDEMARIPVTAHGFHLRPVAEIVEAMTSVGLGEAHARPLALGKRALTCCWARRSTDLVTGTRSSGTRRRTVSGPRLRPC